MARFQDSPFGPACRGAQRFNLTREMDRVAGQHRFDPAQVAKAGRRPPDRDGFTTGRHFAGLALSMAHQKFHADRSDMPSRGRQTAEQRFASLLLVEVKALRVKFRREGLDGVSGEGERTEIAPLPCLDVFKEMHQRARQVAASPRRWTMIGETISHNACPEELLATILNMTMPVVGRLRETRAPATSTSSVMSSPGRNGASQRNSLTPGEPNDAVRPIKPSNIIRMMIEQRCQPDPASPFSIERAAAASSRCMGCGSNSAAKARISSAVTCRGPKRPKGPGLKSSKTRVFITGDIRQGSPIVAALCGNLNPSTRMVRLRLARTRIRR